MYIHVYTCTFLKQCLCTSNIFNSPLLSHFLRSLFASPQLLLLLLTQLPSFGFCQCQRRTRGTTRTLLVPLFYAWARAPITLALSPSLLPFTLSLSLPQRGNSVARILWPKGKKVRIYNIHIFYILVCIFLCRKKNSPSICLSRNLRQVLKRFAELKRIY